LTPAFYQSLLDRGWRRSGTTLYKPDLRNSCCAQYTIRLDSRSFHASKDQRQVQNRFNKHVIGDAYIKESARLYPRSREQAKRRNADFDLVERVHESEKAYLKSPPDPAHNLTIILEPDNYTEEKYTVFENYQRNVHHEPPQKISRSGFKNFLCHSPLPRSKQTFDGRERRLGSYHQCYRLDGKLIAVGVLDLLPQCVSAVYFMYDESVHQHGFGKLGALREIALAKEEGYRWWYAGFYIHSCVKMRYKGDYSPQYVLDPESYNWDPLNDEMKMKLDVKKYISLSRERSEGRSINAAPPTDNTTGPTDKSEVAMEIDSVPDGEYDSDDEPPLEDPELPLFARTMPGILTRDQLMTEVDLDHVKLRIHGETAETCDLVSWETTDMDTTFSIKGIIADLIAAIGPNLARDVIVTFGR
jgi:arginine-tRNA-protein transferase